MTQSATLRVRIRVHGAVQGVGFRPFIYRLAHELSLSGWVLNSAQGVTIEAEGPKSRLDAFLTRISVEKPPRSFLQSVESVFLDPAGYSGFEIRPSAEGGVALALVLPDIATCPECTNEILDPGNRRYLYPFTNCTNCGPRYSIIDALPYDRSNTTMKMFAMCEHCRREYENPLDRRFHAQPNACPECGPWLELWDPAGAPLAARHAALAEAARALLEGRIVAVKGLGGFHLMADARDEDAVRRLRERKHREEKPFALMFPSLESVREECHLVETEERVLLSPEAPILLLRRKTDGPGCISPAVAPANPYLGIMLASTPLHHLLMRELEIPVVATSGNLSDEPICTDESDALKRLGGIADLFLVHNRPIRRHVDDSIVRLMMGREMIVRRARGYAPLPVQIPGMKEEDPACLLAVGAHLKNSVALTRGENAFISQHIGDLETAESYAAFQNVIASLQKLYAAQPQAVAADLHGGYLSTQFAEQLGLPLFQVQHHHAHVASCMAENALDGDVLGVSWDGTGRGTDGTVWGGEFLLTDGGSFKRVGCLRRFRLPGGEQAIREPRRSALGVLYELFGGDLLRQERNNPLEAFSRTERTLLVQMLQKHVNAPVTSSAGRLFDAVASIVGLRQKVSFEGQAAMELEFAAMGARTAESYPFTLKRSENPMVLDWAPMVEAILEDVRRTIHPSVVAAQFHNTLAEMILEVARAVGEERVVLTGGCFQNRYLTERAITLLEGAGFRTYWHQRVPPNDGGIALGQIAACIRSMRNVPLQETAAE